MCASTSDAIRLRSVVAGIVSAANFLSSPAEIGALKKVDCENAALTPWTVTWLSLLN